MTVKNGVLSERSSKLCGKAVPPQIAVTHSIVSLLSAKKSKLFLNLVPETASVVAYRVELPMFDANRAVRRVINLEPSFLELRLLFWRQAFIDMKQNCLSASNVRSFRSVKQHSASEVDARRWLMRTYNSFRKLRDEESKPLRRRYGLDAEYGAVSSYFTGERGNQLPFVSASKLPSLG